MAGGIRADAAAPNTGGSPVRGVTLDPRQLEAPPMQFKSRPKLIAVSALLGVWLLVGGLLGSAGAQTPSTGPVSYINPDKGMPTANPDVDQGSSCESPDQSDSQPVGEESSGSGNLHNDACLFDASGNDMDAQVAFESSGAGLIFGCPDPDGDGPKTANNTKNRTLCVLSGFESGGANGAAGDGEYHARMVSGSAGIQTVTFCADPEGDGCGNSTARSSINITWTAAAAGSTRHHRGALRRQCRRDGPSPDDSGFPVLPALEASPWPDWPPSC